MEDDKLYKEIADLCKPVIYGTYEGVRYSAAEVKILCIEAIIYFMERQGEEKIDINNFFKLMGI